jgi:multiple sugar transport system permease protein
MAGSIPGTTADQLQPRRGIPILGSLTEDTMKAAARRKALFGYLFLLPTMVAILAFTVGPIVASFGLSFFNWDIISPIQFAGLANYKELFQDPRMLRAFGTTALFVVVAVTLQIGLGLFLALLVERQIKPLRYLFRSVFFFPLITSAAGLSIVLAYMFNDRFGVINYYLSAIGLPPVPWLSSGSWALVTVILVFVWQQFGFTFILFVAALTNLPGELLEAAAIDGANGLAKLWHITIPLISPTILFSAIVGVINAIQVFDQAYVLTRGGPGDATRTVVMRIYESGFQDLQLGYAASIAVVLFVVILGITALQFVLSRSWVFYQ